MKKLLIVLTAFLIFALLPMNSFAASGDKATKVPIKEGTEYNLNEELLLENNAKPDSNGSIILSFVPEHTGIYIMTCEKFDFAFDFVVWDPKDRSSEQWGVIYQFSQAGDARYATKMLIADGRGNLLSLKKGKEYRIQAPYDEFDPCCVKHFKITYDGPATADRKKILNLESGQVESGLYKISKSGIKIMYKPVTFNGWDIKVDGFDIYRSNKCFGDFKKIGSTTKKSYLDRTAVVRSGRRYYYKVIGYCMIGGKKYTISWRTDCGGLPLRVDCL